MSKKIKFYGVAGVNAYGVYNDYGKVQEAQEYIRKFKVKSFQEFEDAKDWAEETYYELQGDSYYNYEIEEIKKLNWCYYRKKNEWG